MCKSPAYKGKDLSNFKKHVGRRIVDDKPRVIRSSRFVGHVKDPGLYLKWIKYYCPTVE